MLPGGLTAFHAVAEAGSIRRASQALGVAPSSVSRQIAVLERQIGTILLDRSAGGISLTHAGKLVASYARSAVLDFDSLRADLDDLRGSRRRLIRIAMVESIVSGGPMDAVHAFRQRFDSVVFEMKIVPAPQIVELVKRGGCDVGISFCAPPDLDIRQISKLHEPVVLVTPPGHPLTYRPAVALPDIARWPVALPGENYGFRQMFDRACHAAGLDIKPVLTANGFEAIRDFVRSQAGIGVLPYRAVAREQRLGHLSALTIDDPALTETTIEILVRRSRIARVVRLFAEDLASAILSWR